MTKFASVHDEWAYGYTMDGFGSTSGDVAAPTGWFAVVSIPDKQASLDADDLDGADAIEHYGTPWLLIHESNEGFVTVRTFERVEQRDEVFRLLERDYFLWSADITDGNVREAVDGYLQAQKFAGHVVLPDAFEGLEPAPNGGSKYRLDGSDYLWSQQAQAKALDDVCGFLIDEHESIKDWREATGHGWLQVGVDFAFSRNGESQTFATRDNADAVPGATSALVEYAVAVGKSRPFINEDEELGLE